MSFAYLVASVIILHFVIGIAYLIYKISTAKPTELPDHSEDFQQKPSE